ncbi:MAG: TetR/AcrR family transcriptional regulator [Candidatus Binatia bacterium]
MRGRKKTEAKELQILRAAGEVFATKEYHLVLMEEVALRAGVGKGTLYRYFPTKEDLFFATLFDGLERLGAEIEAVASSGDSFRARLEGIACHILRFMWPHRPIVSLLEQYEARLRGPQGAEWLEKRTQVVDRVGGLFAGAAERSEIRTADARLGAELFLGMVRAANVYRSEGDSPEDLGRRVVDVLLHGIGGAS